MSLSIPKYGLKPIQLKGEPFLLSLLIVLDLRLHPKKKKRLILVMPILRPVGIRVAKAFLDKTEAFPGTKRT